jgi:glycosyltransferase involved in cell wall biosynthesis
VKISYVNADPGVPVFGTKGSSLHVREIIGSFLKRGAEIELFAVRPGGEKPASWRPVRMHQLSSGDGSEESVYNANEHLQSALEESSCDMVYERYSLWSFAGMEFARERQIPGILEVNAPLIREQSAYRELSNHPLAEEVAQRAFMAATALIAVSEEVADYLASCGVSRDKLHVIPNAINPERFSSNVAPAMPVAPGQCTIGFVGSLRPWHGLHVLIDAFKRVAASDPSYRLLIVGDGPERARLSSLATPHLSLVTMVGAVPADEVPAWLASIDLAVAPYPAMQEFYFSPLKVYEYMAAGRAVIASRIGQLQTLLEHGHTGWHVPPGDAGALADAIVYLRERPQLRARIGQAARKMVLANHTWDAVAERILRIAGLNAIEVAHGAA